MARVNIDQNKKILTAHRLAGPHVRRTANQIVAAARRMAPRGTHQSGSGTRKPGLPLTQSLQIDSKTTVTSIVERVGSRNNYAATVHQGSQAHYIHGRGRKLKFQWDRGDLLLQARRSGRLRGRGRSARLRRHGDYFFFTSVHHPGNKRPVRFLTTPMHLYGRLYGFRTSSRGVNRTRLP